MEKVSFKLFLYFLLYENFENITVRLHVLYILNMHVKFHNKS